MTPIERVQAVIAGKRPDRPPVSFWHHFSPEQAAGPAAVEAHLKHVESFELDFLKVMNDNGYPHDEPIESIDDLAALEPLRGDEPAFAAQLELLSELRKSLGGRVLMSTTIFNAFTTLRKLTQPPKVGHGPPSLDAGDPPSATVRDYYAEDPGAVESAIRTISGSLANFAKRCIEAGADGVFLSVREDWVDPPGSGTSLYDQLVRPTDLQILGSATAGRLNMLHVCGKPLSLRRFNDYPVHVINWADRAAGPSIADAAAYLKPAICGGVNNLTTLPEGTPESCASEVADALAQAGNRPILIAPGCTYNPAVVPRENLEAVSRAVRS